MKKSTGKDLPQQYLEQARYPGSDVPGMEYTNAQPIGQNGRAPAKLPQPGKTWPGSLCHYSTTNGTTMRVKGDD